MREQNDFKVVVAEDEYLILENITKKINQLDLGFRVIKGVQNGREALSLIEERLPDLIVTDIKMPLMDGLELLEKVSFYYPHIKKIIISGYDEFEYARQALRYDVMDYLLKPVKQDALAAVLKLVRVELEEEFDSILAICNDDNGSYSIQEVVKLVEKFIKENYAQDINVNMIAQRFNYSATYLSKVFTKCLGENPSSYLIKLRINKARQLLLNEKDLTVKDIGELVGYADPAYFSRIFKKYTSQSPSQFRKAHR